MILIMTRDGEIDKLGEWTFHAFLNKKNKTLGRASALGRGGFSGF